MMGHRYLLDNNVLSRLSEEERSRSFIRENCRVPSEVLYEARFFQDAGSLVALEYRTTGRVLQRLQEVMERVAVDDVRLVNLYSGKGNADPMLVACALDAVSEENEGLFGDDWAIISNDDAVCAMAGLFGIPVLTSGDLDVLLGDGDDGGGGGDATRLV
ncbi:hypothetical protein KZI27_10555 [Curtobacterium sp. TC1]|uniref:hypothetical protein n=1 Tax=Curtobacterium sp. TC1 TaxID=2862880 RepID=UPI001C9AD933|nr:hypothetical protein [Curtobacterium sp. TC1]QZQ53808.1 hypothetical protein KZI27_10555 [Curtobacterium sp. TC1]